MQASADGKLVFVSLAAQIPPAQRHIGKVRSISCTRSEVWFTTTNALYRWQPATRQLTPIPAAGVVRSFAIGGSLYVYSRPSGLSRLDGVSLSPVPGADSVPRTSIWSVARFHSALVIATPTELYRQENDKFVLWRTDADPVLRGAGLYAILPLRNGELAVATYRRGLLLIGPDGKLDRIIDRESGLRSDAVRSIFEDHEEGLWLAMERGIARVEAGSPITTYGEREAIGETVYSIARSGGHIYAGTALGLNWMEPAHSGLFPRFTRVDGVGQQVFALLTFDSELIAGTGAGVFSALGNQGRVISEGGAVYDLARSAIDPNILYAAGDHGLRVLRRVGPEWQLIQQVKTVDREFRTVLERSDGSLWITARSAIYRVDWKQQPAKVETFGGREGVPEGWSNAYLVNGLIVFATTTGLRRFDEATHHFQPDFAFGKQAADGSHDTSIIRESKDGHVWVSGTGYQAMLQKTGNAGYAWIEAPLARAAIKQLYGLYFDDDGTVWASGIDGGMVRYSIHEAGSPAIPSLALRRVEFLKSKRLVFDGETTPSSSLKFAYADNALRFEFALPAFDDASRTEYQVWLKGLDRDWSTWSTETQKEYTNLYEKQYTLQVRARDLYGSISAPVQFNFRIRPPWYRTWWSFILYFAWVLGAVAFIIRLRISQLAAGNRRLEAIITARTSTISEQRDKIEAKEKETNRLLLNILPPQVADELRITGHVQPVSRSNVAICFTDFVGFTISSETMTAQKLVAALHTYFVAFDEVISRYGLEKLKTIGDAYMFVGGVPETKSSFAVDTVLAAMELVQIVGRLADTAPGVGWKVRVGVNCGSAITGVVGSKKFAFDIWGNSVNLASRMESSGRANAVNISANTYELVRDFIDCEPRGLIKTKEGRYLEMYFARRIRPELMNGDKAFQTLYESRFDKAPPPIALTLQSEEAPSQLL